MGSVEEDAYVNGIFEAFAKQLDEYIDLTKQLMKLEAQITFAEKQLRIARDHLLMVIERTPNASMPEGWKQLISQVRFVGIRLADACIQLLSERGQMTTAELIDALNKGLFHWRSNSPAREINAAMLRQPDVNRENLTWIYRQYALQIKESEK